MSSNLTAPVDHPTGWSFFTPIFSPSPQNKVRVEMLRISTISDTIVLRRLGEKIVRAITQLWYTRSERFSYEVRY